MYKILRDEDLKQFIEDLNIEYEEEIFSIIISCSNSSLSKYIINGTTSCEIETEKLKKYL